MAACTSHPHIEPGDRFGRLTVVEVYDNWHGRFRVKAECDCGGFVDERPRYLLIGKVKSCGCYRRDRAATLKRRAS